MHTRQAASESSRKTIKQQMQHETQLQNKTKRANETVCVYLLYFKFVLHT